LFALFKNTTAKTSWGRSINLACKYFATEALPVIVSVCKCSDAILRLPNSNAACIIVALAIPIPLVFISSLTVNEITGVNLSSIGQIISTYSTLYWSTGTGINTLTSSLRVSTIEGVTSPIINFDQANNRIGINLGNTPPRTTVDVGGTVFASNFVTTSDRRMKTNLEPLSFKTPLPSYRFEWRGSGEKDIGVMADDVEAVAPECVYTDDGGYKAVNYSKLVPVCFSILNDMCARMSTLESRALQCKCH
jgi:hypothetical protein